jgi:hypothetical protein
LLAGVNAVTLTCKLSDVEEKTTERAIDGARHPEVFTGERVVDESRKAEEREDSSGLVFA